MTTISVIHGHFYQPPRENPWTGVDRARAQGPPVPRLERAHSPRVLPHQRVRAHLRQLRAHRADREQLRPHQLQLRADAAVVDGERRARRLPRASSRPTARALVARGGHGNAIAQAYNHAILPLCNERDRLTQVRWGLADFRHRFGREPESMWLPETAVQRRDARGADRRGHDVRDPLAVPGRARAPDRRRASGRASATGASIPASRTGTSTATARAARSRSSSTTDRSRARSRSRACSSRARRSSIGCSPARGGPRSLIHVATDGESYGHHFRLGELHARARARRSRRRRAASSSPTTASSSSRHPPTLEVEIKPGPGGEGTSWSCAHGVGRWYRDCGCHTDAQRGVEPGVARAAARRRSTSCATQRGAAFRGIAAELLADPWARARRVHRARARCRRESRDEWLGRHAQAPARRRASRSARCTFLETAAQRAAHVHELRLVLRRRLRRSRRCRS